jgi:hypothetical protein
MLYKVVHSAWRFSCILVFKLNKSWTKFATIFSQKSLGLKLIHVWQIFIDSDKITCRQNNSIRQNCAKADQNKTPKFTTPDPFAMPPLVKVASNFQRTLAVK